MNVMKKMTGTTTNAAALQSYLRKYIGLTDNDITALQKAYLVTAEELANSAA